MFSRDDPVNMALTGTSTYSLQMLKVKDKVSQWNTIQQEIMNDFEMICYKNILIFWKLGVSKSQ